MSAKPSNLSLKTRLLLMMASLCLVFIASLYYLYSRAEEKLIDEVRHETEDLATAFQISIEELSKTEGEVDIEKFKLLTHAKRKRIQEISLVDTDKDVLASSNPALIGKKLEIKGARVRDIGNVTEFSSPSEGQKRFEIILPVVVDKELLGYIHLSTEFDDFSEITRKNHISRLVATIIIFTVGILAAMYLSRKYTGPIQEIADAARKVAAGDLNVSLPEAGTDEIGALTRNFNDMVLKLKERRRLEERLKEAEHMSKIGVLASGIAHEVRNPLNFINLSIDHLRATLKGSGHDKDGNYAKTIQDIKSEIERLDGMVSNFLDFGRPLTLILKPIAIDSVVEETIKMIPDLCGQNKIKVSYAPSGTGLMVSADYRHFKTCVLNVFLNAIQAMPEGGSIYIETFLSGGYAIFRVHDTGCGVSKEDITKVFDPYFTTKDVGIGLGLAFTKRIVEEHGGRIAMDSEEGVGTTVEIALPAL